jgi:hypothetical protein
MGGGEKMKKNYLLGKGLVLGIVFLVIFLSSPITSATTDSYNDRLVILVGKCNTVYGPYLWGLGLYIPILKKDITIVTNGEEGEAISIFVGPPGMGVYYSKENIRISLQNARGIFFWSEKSLFLNNTPPFLIIICKAERTLITT